MAGIKMKMAQLNRFLKRNKKEDDKRSDRTKATQKAAGDTDISYMVTPGVMPEKKKESQKQPEREVPKTTQENIDRAYKIAMMLKKNRKQNSK